MKLDDIFEERIENSLQDIISEQMDFEQALISKKKNQNAFSVAQNFVNSKSFHDKFELLPVSETVRTHIYKEAGRLLDFVDGLEDGRNEEERMVAINARTGELVVDNFDRSGSPEGTGFSDEEMKEIKKCKDGIIVIHNHSHNGPPSATDLITYHNKEDIKLSVIVCHNGDVYAIYNVSDEFEKVYKDMFAEYHYARNIEEKLAKKLVMDALYILNNKLSRHKLFDVREM